MENPGARNTTHGILQGKERERPATVSFPPFCCNFPLSSLSPFSFHLLLCEVLAQSTLLQHRISYTHSHSFLLPNFHSCSQVFIPATQCSFLLPNVHSCYPDVHSCYPVFIPVTQCSFLLPSVHSCYQVFIPVAQCSFL